MSKLALLPLVGFFALACCTRVLGADVTGSGTKASATRTVGAFTTIDASGAFALDIHAGAAETSVVVEGDDNIVPLFVTEVSNGTLALHLPNGSYDTKVPLHVRVSTPMVQRVESSGAIQVDVVGLTGPKFDSQMSGACKLSAAGKVDLLEVHGSGAAKLEAFDVLAQDVNLHLSGATQANVNAARKLTVDASGASTVHYRGTPQVESSVSGASKVAPE